MIFKYIYRIRLNLGILLSLLIISISSYFIFNALNSFYSYKNAVAPKMVLTLDIFHFFLKNELKKEKLKFTVDPVLSDTESPLKTFHITVKQKDIDSLNSNLPTSGKDNYIDGYLKISDDEKIKKIKLRYRGDNNFHWLYNQKSLRIKFSKNNIYNMEKKLNLINPPLEYSILDILNYKYASNLGLISPNYFPIRVFINGKYFGEYMYLSQIDESLLRKHKRMPGSIYSGDSAKKDKVGNWDLWQNSSLWEKKSSRNAEQKLIREDIDLFIEKSNGNGISFYNFFNNYLDKNKFYNFFALDTFFGTNHHDEHHNHKIYFDPYKGSFEPIEWDIRFWTKEPYKDMSIYKLIQQVKLNPILEFERDVIAYKILLSKEFSIEFILKDLYQYKNNLKQDLQSDMFKDKAIIHKLFPTWISVPFGMKEFHDSIASFSDILKQRREILLKIYNDSNVYYKIIGNKIIFKVEGNSPVKISLINTSSNIYKDINFNGMLDSMDIKVNKYDILYPGRKVRNDISNQWPDILRQIESSPLYYSYLIEDNQTFQGKIIAMNAVTDKPMIAVNSQFNIDTISDSIHPWELPKPKYQTKILKGVIEVNKTLIFDKYTKIIIKPNTTFIMDKNTSIYFYAKVIAIGTKEAPIKFIAKDIHKPWGLVAVQGKATTGSEFEYVEFKNGSIDTHNLIHYTSQFNIHDMDWFEVRHCKIGRNFVGDDAMHIAYAKGVVDNCEFKDARSDGLDIDISEVNITNNIFYNSGNDGLDIMTTIMNADNNQFIDMGDKGISVGEWSEANITNTTFTRTVIGLEIKDKSKVIADNLIFIDSKEKAINLYNKNKRYDTGGFLEATNIKFIGNDIVKADKRSKYEIK